MTIFRYFLLFVLALSGCATTSEIHERTLEQIVVSRDIKVASATANTITKLFVWTDGKSRWYATVDPQPICTINPLVRTMSDWEEERGLQLVDKILLGVGFASAAVFTGLTAAGIANGSSPGGALAGASPYILPGLGIGIFESVRARNRKLESTVRDEYTGKVLDSCPADRRFRVDLLSVERIVPVAFLEKWVEIVPPITSEHEPGMYTIPIDFNERKLVGVLSEEYFSAATFPEGQDDESFELDLPKLCSVIDAFSENVNDLFYEQPVDTFVVPEEFVFDTIVPAELGFSEFAKQVNLLNKDSLNDLQALTGKTLRLPTVMKTIEQWGKRLPKGCE